MNDTTRSSPEEISESIDDADLEAPIDYQSVSAEDAQMEDTVRLAGIGIEDVDSGDPSEATIMRISGSFVIRIHRQAPARAWVLQHALAFIQCGHREGLRTDTFLPGVVLDVITPPLSS